MKNRIRNLPPVRFARWARALAFQPLQDQVSVLRRDLERARFALAVSQLPTTVSAPTMAEAELRCYSQFGEDGVIQWLLARVPVATRRFVEIGVEDYSESNTRFLLEHSRWSGLIVDGARAHEEFIRRTGIAYMHQVDARTEWVTREGINTLLAAEPQDLGILSIDIDGMDYWVLDAIEVVKPRILICEYNSLFGPTRPVSVPYTGDFHRAAAHYSWLYFGASIAALAHWGKRNGYRLVGSTSEGVNAFLVRDDVAGDLPSLTPAEAWVDTQIRQSRDRNGRMSYVTGRAAQLALMADLPLIDVVTGERIRVGELA